MKYPPLDTGDYILNYKPVLPTASKSVQFRFRLTGRVSLKKAKPLRPCIPQNTPKSRRSARFRQASEIPPVRFAAAEFNEFAGADSHRGQRVFGDHRGDSGLFLNQRVQTA